MVALNQDQDPDRANQITQRIREIGTADVVPAYRMITACRRGPANPILPRRLCGESNGAPRSHRGFLAGAGAAGRVRGGRPAPHHWPSENHPPPLRNGSNSGNFSRMTSPEPGSNPENVDTRCGYVTLVGPPNAGKSTLMNALIGERLSIVTAKAQTTWQRVTGILTTDRAQMIFLDTPGLLEPRDLLQRAMLTSAEEALGEADLILLVLDGSLGEKSLDTDLIRSALQDRPPVPLLAAINKTDQAKKGRAETTANWVSQELGGEPFLLCALDGTGVDPLLGRLEEALPEGPFLYPEDEVARDPVRFFVAEMIRETIFEDYHQEIPYSVFSQIEEFREDEDPIYIQVHIFVERKSQKGILIGKKGSSIRKLGSRSREKIEDFLGRRVYLDLWIKVLPDWRRKRAHLKKLGFSVPEPVSGR